MTKHEPNRRMWALEYVAAHPAATVRQIMDEIGLASTSAVVHVLRGLEQDGLLSRGLCTECGHRNLIVTSRGHALLHERKAAPAKPRAKKPTTMLYKRRYPGGKLVSVARRIA